MNYVTSESVGDLLEKINIAPPNGICEFVLKNNTPPQWRVRIVQGGAKFFYSDGTDYTDGPKNLHLDSGDQCSFYSNDANKCVKQVFLAITVSAPGEDDAVAQGSTEMAPDGQCWVRLGLELGPKNIISETEIGARTTVGSRFELVPFE